MSTNRKWTCHGMLSLPSADCSNASQRCGTGLKVVAYSARIAQRRRSGKALGKATICVEHHHERILFPLSWLTVHIAMVMGVLGVANLCSACGTDVGSRAVRCGSSATSFADGMQSHRATDWTNVHSAMSICYTKPVSSLRRS